MYRSVRRKSKLIGVEIGVVALLAAVLIVIELYLPSDLESVFVLRLGADAINPATFVTSAFVHFDAVQLRGNVLGYLIAVLCSYAFCVAIGERQWFWLSFVAILVLVPFLSNWASVNLFRHLLPNGQSRGFSAVAAGYVGFLFVSILAFVRSNASRETTIQVGLLVVLLVLAQTHLVFSNAPDPVLIALVLGGVVLLLGGILKQARGVKQGLRTIAGRAVAVGAGVLVFLFMIRAMFPPAIAIAGQFTNVFAHVTGLLVGVITAAWGHRYWAGQHW